MAEAALNTTQTLLDHQDTILFSEKPNLWMLGGVGCVDADTEYLSPNGWVKISSYSGGKVGQFDIHSGEVSFVLPDKFIKAPCDDLFHFKTKYGIEQKLSFEHNLLYYTKRNNPLLLSAVEFALRHERSAKGFDGKIKCSFNINTKTKLDLSDEKIRLQIAVIADGAFDLKCNTNRCTIRIKKERKKERLRDLLSVCGIDCDEHNCNGADKDFTVFHFNAPKRQKVFEKEWYLCNYSQLEIVCDEVLRWDGDGKKIFSTTIKESADFVQYAFAATNRGASISINDRRGRVKKNGYVFKSIEYAVVVSGREYLSFQARPYTSKAKIKLIYPPDGYKYCFQVPSGALVLRCNDRIFITGNSGKTEVGSYWTAKKLPEIPPGVIGIIVANSYAQLIDSTCRNLYKNLKKWGAWFTPKELPKHSQPFNIQIWNGKHWCEILCRSLDNYELLSGVEAGWAWADEVYGSKKEALDVLQARIRDTRMFNQLLFTTTLDEPTSPLYDRVVDNYNEEFDEVVYATTYSNTYLPPGYIKRLKASYSVPMFKRMCLAQWVSLYSGLIYAAFSRANNVTEEAEFDPALPILWGHDFNIGQDKPISSCLAHIKQGKDPEGKPRPELHFFDEIIIDSADTNDVVQEMQGKAYLAQTKNKVIVYGDAAGKARDTRSKKSDYIILAESGFKLQKVPMANPPIRERHNSVNAMLHNANGDIRIKINPRCKTLIKGFETVKAKKGAHYIEEETREQHVTTAAGYLIHKEFPIRRFADGRNEKHWK